MSSMTAPAPRLSAWALAPWTDRAGRLSALKLVVFLAVLAPGVWIAALWLGDGLGPKPLTEAIHLTGDWAVRLLAATLAVTPLRVVTRYNRLILVRRMLGLATLAYATIHVALYCVQQDGEFARIAAEIALRFYLTIGFVAFAMLLALGVTSNDAAVRRVGAARWNALHRLVYVIAGLALFHYFLQTKNDVTPAVLWAGLILMLLMHRLLARRGAGRSPLALAGLAIGAGLVAALVEAAWYFGRSRLSPLDVLAGNLDFDFEIRPPWIVAAVALALPLLALAARRFERAR